MLDELVIDAGGVSCQFFQKCTRILLRVGRKFLKEISIWSSRFIIWVLLEF